MDEARKELHLAVKGAYDAGLCIVPPREDGSKAPETYWKEFQAERASIEVLRSAYRNGRCGLGIICGAVSGQLECLDFDTREIYALFKAACGLAGLDELLERMEAGYSEVTPNGHHLLYRPEKCGRCQKLARTETFDTLIEVKAEGGYVIVAPTYGPVNKDGPYIRLSGSAATIPNITMEEREALHRVAATFDATPKVDGLPYYGPVEGAGNRVGDDFIRRGSWDFLAEVGWRKVAEGCDPEGRPQEFWRRPGKDRGNSAILHPVSGLFYVFSTSTPFPVVPAAYNKFRSYAFLMHEGESRFRDARVALEALGYKARTHEETELEAGGVPERLVIRTAIEIAALTPEEVPWLAPPFFVLGAITEIDGKIKTGGKTTFTLAAVRAVTAGLPFLEGDVLRGPVVLLSEQPNASLRQSLARAGLLETADLHIAQWGLNHQAGWALTVLRARALCREVGARFLVVDTFSQWSGIRGETENQSGAMLRAMEPLQLAAQEDDLALAVLRHDRKSGGEVGDSGRGSSAIGGAVDTIIQIRRSGGREQTIRAVSRFDEVPESLIIRLDPDGTYSALGATDEVLLGRVGETVLGILRDALRPLTATEIGVGCGDDIDRETIRTALFRLTNRGAVVKSGEGKKGSPFRWGLGLDV